MDIDLFDKISPYLRNLPQAIVRGGSGFVQDALNILNKPNPKPKDYLRPVNKDWMQPKERSRASMFPPGGTISPTSEVPSYNVSPDRYTGVNAYFQGAMENLLNPIDSLSRYFPSQQFSMHGPVPQSKVNADMEVMRQALLDKGWQMGDDQVLYYPESSQQPPSYQLASADPRIGMEGDPWAVYGRPSVNPYSDLISEIFGPEASDAESILRWGTPGLGTSYGNEYGGENLSFNPEGIGYNPSGNTYDYGLYQINTGTFDDYLRRHPDLMAEKGLGSYQDLLDVRKNIEMAKLVRDMQGWGAWYGAPSHLLE